MAEQEQKNTADQSTAGKTASSVGDAAKAAAGAAKAVAKGASGNIAGAALEVVRNPALMKAIVAIVLALALLIPIFLFCIGGSVYALITEFATMVEEAWDEEWEQAGVSSGGSLIYLYTAGLIQAGSGTIATVVGNIAEAVIGQDPSHSNNNIDGVSPNTYTQTDLANASESLYGKKALVGRTGILHKQLDMIKQRVSQRGNQIAVMSNPQYGLDAIGLGIAEYLYSALGNPFLFNGVNLEDSTYNFDMTAFELTDAQALKILAAYTVQNDCRLEQQEMWDLMDYCGWYALDMEAIDTEKLGPSNIYETFVTRQSFTRDIGGVVDASTAISADVYQLPAPIVPKWSGSFAPQWYFEEIAYLESINKEYEKVKAKDPEKAETMLHFETDENGNIILSQFEQLSKVQTFGLVDVLYSSSIAELSVSRTDYYGAEEHFDEAIAKFADSILGHSWSQAFVSAEKGSERGGTVSRDVDGNGEDSHSYNPYETYSDEFSFYLLKQDKIPDAYKGQTEMSIDVLDEMRRWDYVEPNIYTNKQNEDYIIFEDLRGGTAYILMGGGNDDDTLYYYDSFTTFPDTDGLEAYELVLDLEVKYTAVSVDKLMSDYMGLWPGKLTDTETDAHGQEYAKGHVGDRLYLKTWTETYTDSHGNTFEFPVSRQQGHQQGLYEDTLEFLADLLNIDMTGAMAPNYNYGDSIVSVALREYEYYHANGLTGGDRYWQGIYDAVGDYRWLGAGWCVAFVWYCAYQCGYIGPGGAFGNWEKWEFWPGCAKDLLVDAGHGKLYTDAEYIPSPGDLIFLDDEIGFCGWGTNHIGIVKCVNEDGSVTTIEGNAGDNLVVKTYSHYSVGTYCYTYTNDKGEKVVTYISSYIRPDYPQTYAEDPMYTKIPGAMLPVTGAKTLGGGNLEESQDYDIVFFGLGRFRPSQMAEVASYYSDPFPSFFGADGPDGKLLAEALERNDMAAAIDIWNRFAESALSGLAKESQFEITRKIQVDPVAREIYQRTGISWETTPARKELLWGLATTTANNEALVATIQLAMAGMKSNTADEDLIAAMLQGDMLYSLLLENRAEIWAGDPEHIQIQWCNDIQLLLKAIDQRLKNGGFIGSDGKTDWVQGGGLTDVLFPGNGKPGVTDPNYNAFSMSTVFAGDYVADGKTMPFMLYTPSSADDYSSLPLIVWLHGVGGRSEVGESGFTAGTSFMAMMKNWKSTGFNAYVIGPHLTGTWDRGRWDCPASLQQVLDIINRLVEEGYNIDTSRIVVAGHSLGGQGVLYFAWSRPDIFKKAATLSPYYAQDVKMGEITVPIRAYCGTTSAGEAQHPVDLCHESFIPLFGAENCWFIECNHGRLPNRAFSLDENDDGRSDLIEWLLDFSDITPAE